MIRDVRRRARDSRLRARVTAYISNLLDIV